MGRIMNFSGWRRTRGVLGALLCGALLFATGAKAGTMEVSSKADGSKDLFRTNVVTRTDFACTGYVQATLYPPHDEYPANFGLPFKDEATARWGLSGDVTVEHLPSHIFGGIYLFMPMGNTKPQTSYNYAADPIFLQVQPTLGYQLSPYLDMRVTYNEDFDLGKFTSRHEVTPWLSLSMRASTVKPLDLWGLGGISGYSEVFLFAPGLEYPASPGASPAGYPVENFSRSQIVNARYALAFNLIFQPKWKYLNMAYLYAAPELYFGDATLDDHDRWGGQPLTAYLEWGVGVRLTRNLEFRFSSATFENLGNAPDGLLAEFGEGLSLRYVW